MTKPGTHRIKCWYRVYRDNFAEVIILGAGVQLHWRRDEIVTRVRAL